MFKTTLTKAMAVIIHRLATSSNPTRDDFVLNELNKMMVQQYLEKYPLGSICRIWQGTEYDHIVIGHILRENQPPLLQVIKTNPTASNDLYVNIGCHDVHLQISK